MAEIILAVLFGLVGLFGALFTVFVLPWAMEPNAPKGVLVIPLVATSAGFGLCALLVFGG